MRLRLATLRSRLYWSASAVFLAGNGSAAWIYLAAEKVDESALISDFLNSKRYLHEVKSYGGNASVLADQFSRWFDGLWHGETLALTVAVLTLVASLILAFAGYHTPPHE